ncbi:hypothetical protein A2U01_0074130, partial [Trifolium medium]|nr:hypothetical protein [Trifolium medium]
AVSSSFGQLTPQTSSPKDKVSNAELLTQQPSVLSHM